MVLLRNSLRSDADVSEVAAHLNTDQEDLLRELLTLIYEEGKKKGYDQGFNDGYGDAELECAQRNEDRFLRAA